MKKTIVCVLSALIALSLGGCVSDSDFNDLKNEVDELKSEVAALNSGNTVTTPADEAGDKEEIVVDESDADYILTAGTYEVTVEVEEGKYDVVYVSGDGIFEVQDFNDPFYTNGEQVVYESMGDGENDVTSYNNLVLSSGQTISIEHTLKVKLVKK
ncbi:MAG: hypothetical protein LUD03_04950 [Firmicutes bacterium]|nr:hypothetical protein [Bacillota bacterium]